MLLRLRATTASHRQGGWWLRYIYPVGIWMTFANFRFSTRVLLIASIIFGLACLCIGIIFDQMQPAWLDGRSYFSNIWASLTGFLIGAPFALVVLAAFTVEREEESARQRVNRLTLIAWEKFKNSINELCTDDRIFVGLSTDATMMGTIHNMVFDEYQRRIRLAQTYCKNENHFQNVTDEEISEFQSFLQKRSEILHDHIDRALTTIGAQYQLQISWSIIRTNWNTLTQYVRLQRIERNLEWFADQDNAEFVNRLTPHDHPLTDFMHLHALGSGRYVGSMHVVLETISRDAQSSADELRKKLMAGYTGGTSQLVNPEYRYEFGHERLEGYEAAAHRAKESLLALRNVVQDVEHTGWPAAASKPTETS